MNYNYYLKEYTPIKSKLLEYGFTQNQNKSLSFKKSLKSSGLYALINIDSNNIEVRVIDSNFDDDFLPFSAVNSNCPEKAEVNDILNDILLKCFEKSNTKDQLISYLHNRYKTVCERPWPETPNHCTFKTQNSKKWYAIMMNIKQNRLGFEGENLVDIINIKLNPEKITNLIDNIKYFPAYHMNKKSWITILLNKHTDIEKLHNLIDESYNLVEK